MIEKIKKIIPEFILRLWFKYKWKKNYKFKSLSTQQIFSKIYDEDIWGKDNENKYCSGPGSTTPNAKKYIDFIEDFIQKRKLKSIVDLGCGDFRIMKQIVDKNTNIHFIGIDIVPQLIAYNKKKFGSDRVEFVCLDAITDELPKGELVVVRQVLQHLSNSQIQLILKKLVQYKYILISEHLPAEKITPNIDKMAGSKNRLFFNSGVFLDTPPFSVNTRKVFEFEDLDYVDLKGYQRKSVIATYLIEN